jgi:hypothetical protein
MNLIHPIDTNDIEYYIYLRHYPELDINVWGLPITPFTDITDTMLSLEFSLV